jgi:hypothetical protein
MRYFVIAFMFALAVGAPAFARTDQETFNKLIDKVTAAKDGFKPRVACVCVPDGQPGYILQVPAQNTPIYCVTPTFNPDGSFAGTSNCPGNVFETLGR